MYVYSIFRLSDDEKEVEKLEQKCEFPLNISNTKGSINDTIIFNSRFTVNVTRCSYQILHEQ